MGALAWGKRYTASLIAHRILYEINCLKYPYLAYGLLKDATLVFSIPAQGKILNSIIRTLGLSPFFLDKIPLKLKNDKISFPKNILLGTGPIVGENVFSAIIDTMNLTSNQAETTYNQLKNRIRSRRPTEAYGKLPGILIAISHANNQLDFIKRKIVEATENPKIYVMNYALWEVKPEGFYGEERFWISMGMENQTPKIIEDKDAADNERNSGAEILEVPLEFLQDFRRDLEGSLWDIAGKL